MHALRVSGLPKTLYGRVIVQKTLLMGKAVFFATNQAPVGVGRLRSPTHSAGSTMIASGSITPNAKCNISEAEARQIAARVGVPAPFDRTDECGGTRRRRKETQYPDYT